MNANLEWKIANLPESPGCYLMKHEGEIIYVGKAKNLKNRVSQYFHYSRAHTPKVRAMVEKIDDFDIILVEGELEAFTLECNLIKLHMPHYNILLKDDKAYPYLRVDLAEDFPRIELARRQEKDGAKYFGPYRGGAGRNQHALSAAHVRVSHSAGQTAQTVSAESDRPLHRAVHGKRIARGLSRAA